jgi:hypothetical protein
VGVLVDQNSYRDVGQRLNQTKYPGLPSRVYLGVLKRLKRRFFPHDLASVQNDRIGDRMMPEKICL